MRRFILAAAGVILWQVADTILGDYYGCDMDDPEYYIIWICAIGGVIFVRHALFGEF